jgi:hypothetical protein
VRRWPSPRSIASLDGVSIDDYWYTLYPFSGPDALCHHVAAGDTCVAPENGLSGLLAADENGVTVFAEDPDQHLHRVRDGVDALVEGFAPADASLEVLRRTQGTLWARMQNWSVYRLDDASAVKIGDQIRDVFGTASDFGTSRFGARLR